MALQKRSSKQSSSVPAVSFTTPEPLLLDIKSAARVLSCTTWAVRSLLWSKEIPHIKIGRRFLIDPADLRSYIARQKERAA
jgi:excisionase family DNA binding protein